MWNQLCNPDEFDPIGCTPTESGGVVTISDCAKVNRYKAGFVAVTKGHKYYQTVKIKSDGTNPVGFQNYLFLDIYTKTTSAEFMRLSEVAACKESGNALVQLFSPNQTSYQIVKNSFMLFDLTRMFGKGNEPTAEQFEEMFPDETYPYNPGEIITGTTTAIDMQPVNIFPGTQLDKLYPCTIKKGETFTASATCENSAGKCRYYTADQNKQDYYSLTSDVETTDGITRYKKVIKAPFDVAFVEFYAVKGKTVTDFVVERGSGDGKYKKYFEPKNFTTVFPELRSAMAAHDYIDMDDGQVIRNIGKIKFNELKTKEFENGVFYINHAEIGARQVNASCLTPGFVFVDDELVGVKPEECNGRGYYFRFVAPAEIDTVDKFIEKYGDDYIYFELATSTTEPVAIPEPLQEWLPVEPGGTVTFRNADESKQLAVPNSVSWVRKLNEVN